MPLSLPYFKFNVQDWLTSEKVLKMSGAQVGTYIHLLAQCWSSATCTLPEDVPTLKTLGRWGGSEEEFQPILACFVPKRGARGRLINRRLYTEWLEATQLTQTFKESGQRGALKRWAEKPKRLPKEVRHAVAADQQVDWLASLKANAAYTHINIDIELAKMDAWLSTKPGRKKTKAFVLNWLNKIEAPLSNGHGTTGSAQRPPPPPPKNDPIGRGLWGRTYGRPQDHGYD